MVAFGERHIDREYKVRPGVYAVILKEDERVVAVVKTPSGYYLPGGGLEEGETHSECLKRECLEEIGRPIQVRDYIGQAGMYFYSQTDSVYMFNDGHFYSAECGEELDIPTEEDHEFGWLPFEDLHLLVHDHQQWAVRMAMAKIV